MTQTPQTAETPPTRLVLVMAVLAGIALVAAGGFVWLTLSGTPRGITASLLGGSVGGPFRLTDQNGNVVTDRDLHGKWLLVYFGYTHCPDACPTALNDIALALEQLGARAGKVRPVFITVDPARDTPAVLKSYVASFAAPILALTGSETAVAQAAKAYHVYYSKHAIAAGDDYEMDHSSVIYVMDPQGRFAASFTHENSPKEIAARLARLIG
jgi:protein SCO1/2